MSLKSIVIDLDDTICFPNHAASDTHYKYRMALPNLPMIEAMHRAKSSGYHIIIHSARRMLTHGGDLNRILEDVGQVTRDWLAEYNVPYDELIFGKPYATTWYVDDKAMTPEQFVMEMN